MWKILPRLPRSAARNRKPSHATANVVRRIGPRHCGLRPITNHVTAAATIMSCTAMITPRGGMWSR